MRLIEAIMGIAFIVFAVYGTFVLYKWKKCADRVNEQLDELELEQGGELT